MNYKEIILDRIDSREHAINFLLENTLAIRDTIERFVDMYWQIDISDEDNLELFYDYEAQFQEIYSDLA